MQNYCNNQNQLKVSMGLFYHLKINHRTGCAGYFLPRVEIKDYHVVIYEQNYFDQPVKNDLRTHNNIPKIATGQGDDYTTGFLLDYPYFKKLHKVIAIELSKQQTFDPDLKVIKQVNFTGNLDRDGNTKMFFIIEEVKETIIYFSQETVRVL